MRANRPGCAILGSVSYFKYSFDKPQNARLQVNKGFFSLSEKTN